MRTAGSVIRRRNEEAGGALIGYLPVGFPTLDESVEAADWIAASDRTGLDRVFLAAPTSTDTRIRQAVEASRGFVYAVSTMGITGARTDVDQAARTLVSRLAAAGAPASCVGLGISTAAQVAEVLEYADGAIVGSALVKALAEGGVAGAGELAAALARGTRSE